MLMRDYIVQKPYQSQLSDQCNPCIRPAFLNLSTTPLLGDCPLFQAPLTLNKLQKQMYSLVKLMFKPSML